MYLPPRKYYLAIQLQTFSFIFLNIFIYIKMECTVIQHFKKYLQHKRSFHQQKSRRKGPENSIYNTSIYLRPTFSKICIRIHLEALNGNNGTRAFGK